MFYLIENLRSFLNSPEISSIVQDKTASGLYLGRRFFPFKQLPFNSGGAGYLLDAKAVKVLGANIDSPKCWPHQKGFWEDVNVGRYVDVYMIHVYVFVRACVCACVIFSSLALTLTLPTTPVPVPAPVQLRLSSSCLRVSTAHLQPANIPGPRVIPEEGSVGHVHTIQSRGGLPEG